MKIQFINFSVREIYFRAPTISEDQELLLANDLDFGFEPESQEERTFNIFFKLVVTSPTLENFVLDSLCFAKFKLDEGVYDDLSNSDFVWINAPAIAYPYLRAFISTFTLNSGFKAVVLPVYNFIELSKIVKEKRVSPQA